MTNEAGLEFEPNSSGNRLGDNLIEKVREIVATIASRPVGGKTHEYIAARQLQDLAHEALKLLAALEAKPTDEYTKGVTDAVYLIRDAGDFLGVDSVLRQLLPKPTDAPDKDDETLDFFNSMLESANNMARDLGRMPIRDDHPQVLAIRAALRAPAGVPDGWQPIETAPRHGEPILVYWPYLSHSPTVAACLDGEWVADLDNWGSDDDPATAPTHWMPLPAAPTPAKEEKC